jgi:hypothetical protein
VHTVALGATRCTTVRDDSGFAALKTSTDLSLFLEDSHSGSLVNLTEQRDFTT